MAGSRLIGTGTMADVHFELRPARADECSVVSNLLESYICEFSVPGTEP